MHTPGFLLIGGPTVLFGFGGLRWISDPTFDPPTDYGLLRKTQGPAVAVDDLGPIDVALISHHDHRDNLDTLGLHVAREARHAVSPHHATAVVGEHAFGLAAGEHLVIGGVTIHAVPAIHGPEDGARDERGFVNCEVIGFVLESDTQRLYISGDNTSMDIVRDIAKRFGPCDGAIIHAGRASVPSKFAGQPLSMTGAQAAQAATILRARQVVVVHNTQWVHFTEGPDETYRAFVEAGVGDVLDTTPLGQWGTWRPNPSD
ncbi:MBL fold metallo-hydrolase [Schaalia sp. ZJ1691]|uniref:MBL fold metallo-hydrolase n=1 Tax=Schaalia sp. ZJ1691 TaxID=2709404 RepID=UPI0013ED2FC4|nr:MBL fold metallo-hydrolase [Schaalia sp. ZJ1691]